MSKTDKLISINLKLCRLCYEKEASKEILDNNIMQYYFKIIFCCRKINISENVRLPSGICNSCESQLVSYYQFVQNCEETDKKLQLCLAENKPNNYLNLDTLVKLGEGTLEQSNENEAHYEHFSITNNGDEDTATIDNKVKLENDFDNDNNYIDGLECFENIIISNNGRKRPYKKLPKENLVCPECGRQCLSLSALKSHIRSHTNERPFTCSCCNKSYKNSGTLKRHKDRNHTIRERKFICDYCGKGFFSKPEIGVHLRVHTRETPYSCSICFSRFTQLSAMLRHVRRHTGQKTEMCATCGKEFWTKEELKKHYSVHQETRNFSCPICNTLFKQKNNLRQHMRRHSDPKRFVCNYCGRTFNDKGNLMGHIGRKHSAKSGQCSVCLKNVSNLEEHSWKHTGQRPLKCEFCTSSFSEAKGLAHHVNFKHKKTDKFKCAVEGCSRTFPSRPMLDYHVAKFHEKRAPFPCDRCSRKFYRKNDLARHKIHTHQERLV